MNTISFMSANFVAQHVGYHMIQGWGQGDSATQSYFRPIETFGERFEDLIAEVSEMGFTAIDLWGGHLYYAWATEEHAQTARAILDKYGFGVSSLATFMHTADDVAKACDLAHALGTTMLGGGGAALTADYAGCVTLLRQRGIRWAYENHPEKTPDEVLAVIGDAADVVGVALDTGWFATQGYNAASAAEALAERVFLVHLKDVKAAGAHETCRYGTGIVPLAEVVQVMQAHGYSGGYSVEHEPEQFDPTEDCIASLALLKRWLGEA